MELFHSIPRLQPARSMGSRVYLVVPQVPLSHPVSADAAACGERFYVSLRTVVWGKKKPAQTLRKIDCLSECSYRLNSLGSARAERGGYGSVSLAWGHCLMGSFYGIYCVYKHT